MQQGQDFRKMPFKLSPLRDVKIPDTVFEPILMRARFHGIIGDDVKDSDVTEHISDYKSYKSNSGQMLDALKRAPQPDSKKVFANIFGYLFAKAIEMSVNEKRKGFFKKRVVADYTPADAFAGRIHTQLKEDQHKKIEGALELGKQFYKDFFFFMERGKPDDQQFDSEMIRSLIVVQELGKLYAPICMK